MQRSSVLITFGCAEKLNATLLKLGNVSSESVTLGKNDIDLEIIQIGLGGGVANAVSDLPPNPKRSLKAKRLKGMKGMEGGDVKGRGRQRTGGRRAEEQTEMKGPGWSESVGEKGMERCAEGGGGGGRDTHS